MVSFTRSARKDFNRKVREGGAKLAKIQPSFSLRTLRSLAIFAVKGFPAFAQARFLAGFFATMRLRTLAASSAGSNFFADFQSRSRS